jgi:hypothetical protein
MSCHVTKPQRRNAKHPGKSTTGDVPFRRWITGCGWSIDRGPPQRTGGRALFGKEKKGKINHHHTRASQQSLHYCQIYETLFIISGVALKSRISLFQFCFRRCYALLLLLDEWPCKINVRIFGFTSSLPR